MPIPRYLLLMTLLSILCSPAHSTESAAVAALRAQIDALQSQLLSMQARIEDLEGRSVVPIENLDAGSDLPQQEGEKTASVWERLDFKADFRYRYDEQDDDAQGEGSRSRDRIRARAEVIAHATESIDLGFGLISGDEDPLSGNQTLGEGNSSKDWRLDKAYFAWELYEGLTWLGGKYKNPTYRPGDHFLIWDGDLRPEGMHLVYRGDQLFGQLGLNRIDSDTDDDLSSTSDSVELQLGLNLPLGSASQLVLGAGFYYINVGGKGGEDLVDGRGNSIDESGRFVYDYEELELLAELQTEWFGLPALIFADYVVNTDADDEDTGYALGLSIGDAGVRGGYEFSYTWQELEADAVFAFFTDSDFAGGGTDNRGHLVSAAYGLNDKTKFKLSYYDTEYGKAQFGDYIDFERVFVDLSFKF